MRVRSVTAAELSRLYVGEGRSLVEIATEIGCSPSWARQLLLRNGIRTGRRAEPRLRDRSIDVAVARQLYEGGLGVAAVAAHLETTPDRVRVRLRRAGVVLRPVGRHDRRPPGLSRTWLSSAYVRRRMSVEEMAVEAGCSPTHVRNELRRCGIRRGRAPAPPPPGWSRLTAPLLHKLYVEEGLTVREVASRAGGSSARVLAALRRAGIDRRPRGAPSGSRMVPLTPELLERLYVVEGLSAAAVAAQVGGGGGRVLAALARFDIPRRPQGVPSAGRLTISREELVDAYVHRREGADLIAAGHGVAVWQVRLRLRADGVRRPSGAPRRLAPSPPAAELRRLYVEQGWTLAELVAHYRTGRPNVRAWLDEAGVPVAPRMTRAQRRRLPESEVIDSYWDRGWSASEIAAGMGTTVDQVLRCLHDARAPVRLGLGRDGALCVIDQLYADPEVLAALARHSIASRPEPGPIAERFPEPCRLTIPVLRSLYDRLGLSARHVELLTGVPEDQVLDALHAAGIPVRPLGSFSPWRQRQLGAAEGASAGRRRAPRRAAARAGRAS